MTSGLGPIRQKKRLRWSIEKWLRDAQREKVKEVAPNYTILDRVLKETGKRKKRTHVEMENITKYVYDVPGGQIVRGRWSAGIAAARAQ